MSSIPVDGQPGKHQIYRARENPVSSGREWAAAQAYIQSEKSQSQIPTVGSSLSLTQEEYAYFSLKVKESAIADSTKRHHKHLYKQCYDAQEVAFSDFENRDYNFSKALSFIASETCEEVRYEMLIAVAKYVAHWKCDLKALDLINQMPPDATMTNRKDPSSHGTGKTLVEELHKKLKIPYETNRNFRIDGLIEIIATLMNGPAEKERILQFIGYIPDSEPIKQALVHAVEEDVRFN
jgi:hypothetical protein